VSDPIDGLIEWLDKAIKNLDDELENGILGSDTIYNHYYGVVSGYRLARTQARHYKKLKETEQASK